MINKILVFKNSGWCEKLQKSYFTGRYQPKDENEFEALKEFSVEDIELNPVESKPEILEEVKTFSDAQIADLRIKAKEAKIHNWHSKNPNTLMKELGIEE